MGAMCLGQLMLKADSVLPSFIRASVFKKLVPRRPRCHYTASGGSWILSVSSFDTLGYSLSEVTNSGIYSVHEFDLLLLYTYDRDQNSKLSLEKSREICSVSGNILP